MKRNIFIRELRRHGFRFQDISQSHFLKRQQQIVSFKTHVDIIKDSEEERYQKIADYLNLVSDEGFNLLLEEVERYIDNPSKTGLDTLKLKINSMMSISNKSIGNIPVTYPLGKGTQLYRIHSLENFEGTNLNGYEDIIPKNLAKKQRLNLDGEQVLYLAFNERTALKELGLRKDIDKYVVLVYKVKENSKLLPLTTDTGSSENLPKFERFFIERRNKLLVKLFSYPSSVNKGEYDISNYIKSFYNLHFEQRGWLYPSVKSANWTTINYLDSCVALPFEYYLDIVDIDSVEWKYSAACRNQVYCSSDK
ncbi:hypothetical protein ACQTPQ_07695 [Streptococcus hyovaginalis]|uniref:hypothetical protein n=1 Tax=Streptococcus hyovaginalis TaxID=149015 RepID=UPI003AE206C7